MTDYGVRVIVAYQQFSVGQVIYPPGILRDALVQRGFVERLKPPPVYETRMLRGKSRKSAA